MRADPQLPVGHKLTLWVIYKHPRDFPEHYVLRPQYLLEGHNQPVAGSERWTAKTLAEIRALLPHGLTRIARHPTDAPMILESWI